MRQWVQFPDGGGGKGGGGGGLGPLLPPLQCDSTLIERVTLPVQRARSALISVARATWVLVRSTDSEWSAVRLKSLRAYHGQNTDVHGQNTDVNTVRRGD